MLNVLYIGSEGDSYRKRDLMSYGVRKLGNQTEFLRFLFKLGFLIYTFLIQIPSHMFNTQCSSALINGDLFPFLFMLTRSSCVTLMLYVYLTAAKNGWWLSPTSQL
jgi:hypothetical protein